MAGGSSRTLTVNVVGNASGASKAMDDVAGKSDSTGSRMSGAFKSAFGAIATASGGALAPIGEMFDKIGPALDAVKEKGKTVGSVVVGIGVAGAAAGSALTAFGAKDATAMADYGAAVTNTGGNVEEFKKKVEDLAKGNEKYNHSAADTISGQSLLTAAFSDPAKAAAASKVTLELAAKAHITYSEAAAKVVQIEQGKGTKFLVSLGITKQMIVANKDHGGVMDLVTQKTKGYAEAQANTFGGKMAGYKTQVEDMAASMGQKYGPTITAAGPGFGLLGTAMTGAQSVMGMFKHTEELATLGEQAETAAKGLETVGYRYRDGGRGSRDPCRRTGPGAHPLDPFIRTIKSD